MNAVRAPRRSRSLLLLARARPRVAVERILLFVSDVRGASATAISPSPRRSASQAEGREIRRGILRDFPTTYTAPRRHARRGRLRGPVGHPRRRAGDLGHRALANGVRMRIGSADRMLSAGQHEYVIRYRTTRQIGFFRDYDELYWNATGTGWTFAIDRAEARITLPERVPFTQSAFYTGPQGAQRQGRRRSSSSSRAASCSAPRGRCRRATASRWRPPGRRASSSRRRAAQQAG